MTNGERDELEQELRTNLQARRADLAQLWQEMNGRWAFEDGVYRFYHQSFKVFGLQDHTTRIVETLQSLLPGRPLNPWFVQIVKEGTGQGVRDEGQQPVARGHAADRRGILPRPVLSGDGQPVSRRTRRTTDVQRLGGIFVSV